MPDSPHMSVAETALYMRRSKRHVEQLISSGALPSSFDGRRTVHVKDADAYLAKRKQTGTSVGGAA